MLQGVRGRRVQGDHDHHHHDYYDDNHDYDDYEDEHDDDLVTTIIVIMIMRMCMITQVTAQSINGGNMEILTLFDSTKKI